MNKEEARKAYSAARDADDAATEEIVFWARAWYGHGENGKPAALEKLAAAIEAQIQTNAACRQALTETVRADGEA